MHLPLMPTTARSPLLFFCLACLDCFTGPPLCLHSDACCHRYCSAVWCAWTDAGPWKKLLGPNSVPAEVLSYELNTVLSDVNYNETFGYPKDFTTCPVGVCYDPKTR